MTSLIVEARLNGFNVKHIFDEKVYGEIQEYIHRDTQACIAMHEHNRNVSRQIGQSIVESFKRGEITKQQAFEQICTALSLDEQDYWLQQIK